MNKCKHNERCVLPNEHNFNETDCIIERDTIRVPSAAIEDMQAGRLEFVGNVWHEDDMGVEYIVAVDVHGKVWAYFTDYMADTYGMAAKEIKIRF